MSLTKVKQNWGKPSTGRRGPKAKTPLGTMAIGDVYHVEVPTTADCKRVAKNVSQHGTRHDKGFICRTDKATRIMSVTRVR